MASTGANVVVLGAGRVGEAIARDLAAEPAWHVDVCDASEAALARVTAHAKVGAFRADLGDREVVRRTVESYDLVVAALPSAIGFETLRSVIEAGRDVVDISFMPEDAGALSELALRRGVTAVFDCGVAPGLSNMMVGAAVSRLEECEQVDICVGGLPAARHWPFEYKAGFAPWDVLEEYTRPARRVENGRLVVREPLSGTELLDFPGLGTLEAFDTDGLRSLIGSIEAPFMRERTLRWPGHADLMRALRETGFFSLEEIDVGGVRVRPRDVTAALLFPKWQFDEGEADLTVMRVHVVGSAGGRRVTHTWDLLDRYDEVSGLRSMSRTTGFVASATARLLAAGRYRHAGAQPPEVLGAAEGVLDQILADLANRGVRCHASVTLEG